MTNEPPYPEPAGYSAAMGFVKSDPRNNDYYVDQWKNDPWYPIIKSTHEAIKEIAPGYNIRQIKEKFGGLRYYISIPPSSVVLGTHDFENTEDKQVSRINLLLACAESWVEGYEHAKEEYARWRNS